MKLRVAILPSLVMAAALATVTATAQKQRLSTPAAKASAYGLTFHVTRSYLAPGVDDPGLLANLAVGARSHDVTDLHLAGTLDGRDVELAGGPRWGSLYRLLPPGDYRVRLLENKREKDGSVLEQYDLLLANGHHEAFTLVGESQ